MRVGYSAPFLCFLFINTRAERPGGVRSPFKDRKTIFDVTKFGAVGNGHVEDTRAIQGVLTRAEKTRIVSPGNRPVVYFPPNKTFISAPLNISGNLILHIDGTLQAITNSSSNFEDKWPKLPPFPSYGNSRDYGKYLQYQSFLYSHDTENIVIQGRGTIDGQGSWWWDAFLNHSPLLVAGRPNLIQLWNCSDVEITGVTLKDSAFWTLHPIYSRDLHIHHIKIHSHMYAPNVDGIDPDSCQNVLIEHNDISCGDDHIAIKAGVCGEVGGSDAKDPIACSRDPRFSNGDYTTRNVTIRYNTMRIGMGIALGSELSGGIEDVFVYQNVIGLCEHGHEDPQKSCGWGHAIHLKTTITRGGFLRRIHFHRNTIYNNTGFLLLETDYQDTHHVLPPTDYPTTDLRNISIVGNAGLGQATNVVLGCSPYMICEDILWSKNWIQNGKSSNYHCEFIHTYGAKQNWPNGMRECMEDSMNRTMSMIGTIVSH